MKALLDMGPARTYFLSFHSLVIAFYAYPAKYCGISGPLNRWGHVQPESEPP